MARENRLWAWLNKVKPIFRYRLHMNRVENSVLEGMADVEGCLEGRQFWIELKTCARPSNPSTKIKPKFQPKQVPWLKRRCRAEGRAFVLVQVGSGSDAARYLIPGHMAHLVEAGMTEEGLKECSTVGPKATAEQIVEMAAG